MKVASLPTLVFLIFTKNFIINNSDTNNFRIISLVPSQTELLIDLGLEKVIVGVTKFCVHPNHIKKTKTTVGGTKNCNFVKIKSLNPTHILCNKEENTKEIVEECQKIASTHVSEIYTIKDSMKLIETYGILFFKKTEASQLIQKINYKLNSFNAFIKDKPALKVAYFIWRNPWMVAGNNTYINHILELNKFDNVYKNKERYPEIKIEKMMSERKPDLLLLSSEPYPFKEEHGLQLNKTINETKTFFVDGELFSWHGSRLLKAFDYFILLRNSL